MLGVSRAEIEDADLAAINIKNGGKYLVAHTEPGVSGGQALKLTAADATNPPPVGGVVFVGSSSIRYWTTLAEDFPGIPTINRGFGGSTAWEVDAYFARIVPRYLVDVTTREQSTTLFGRTYSSPIGIAPTGRKVEVPLVAIVRFEGDKVAHEHIYWDQASVLVQIGKLDPAGLPVDLDIPPFRQGEALDLLVPMVQPGVTTEALDRLIELSLVTERSPGRRYVPISPDVALDALLSLEQAELSRRERQLLDARAELSRGRCQRRGRRQPFQESLGRRG